MKKNYHHVMPSTHHPPILPHRPFPVMLSWVNDWPDQLPIKTQEKFYTLILDFYFFNF